MPYLRLLGGAILEAESGRGSGLASRRYPLALLALLATAPSRTLSRGKLVGLLWPESPERTARNRLNTYVHQVRSELGETVLISIGDDIRLDPDSIACDVHEFEEALSAGQHERAVGLYRGPFLDGFELGGSPDFEERMRLERDHLEHRHHEALEALAEAAEERGKPEVAANWWGERARQDPYDSRVALRLMQALDAAGNRAVALRVAREHRRLLERELGTTPSGAIRELVARLKGEALTDLPTPTRAAVLPVPFGDGPDPVRIAAGSPARPASSSDRFGRKALFAGLVAAGVALLVIGSRTPPSGAGTAEPGATERPILVLPTEAGSTAARELYLQARHLDGKGETSDQRIELYRRALELDPALAEAWAGLADAYVDRVWAGSERSWADSAIGASRTALEIDPGLADAYSQLGDAYWALGRPVEEPLSAYEKALELDPDNSEAVNNLVTLLSFHGRLAEAMKWLDLAHRLSPDSPGPVEALVGLNLVLGRDDVADAWLDRVRDEGHSGLEHEFAAALFYREDLARARKALEALSGRVEGYPVTRRRAALALYERNWKEARRRYRDLYPGVALGSAPLFRGLLWDPLGLAYALDRLGEGEEAREIAREVIATAERGIEKGDRDYGLRHQMAVAHLILGDEAAAVAWLEEAVDAGYRDVQMTRTIPVLDPVRDHPRFRAMVERMENLVTEERRKADTGGWGRVG